MISEYPAFTKIDISAKQEIQKFVEKFDPYSDFNFVSMFSWNADDEPRLSWLNNNLVIKLRDYVTPGQQVTSILGVKQIDDSLKTLLSATDKIELVPEVVIHNIEKPDDFCIVESRDNYDYIYSLSHLSDLPGKLYKKKRNKANHTRTFFGSRLKSSTSSLLQDSEKQELIDMLHTWQAQSKQLPDDMENEDRAINKILDEWNGFKLLLTRCRVDGLLVGFSINEVVSSAYSICHFEKFIIAHNDIGAYLVNEVAKELARHSTLVNWEQDLGLSGIKRSKSSYYPVKFLRKYTVSLAK